MLNVLVGTPLEDGTELLKPFMGVLLVETVF